jgi:hypothetical protein
MNVELIRAVEQLLEETENKEDALNYASEIANELNVTVDEVVDEINKQVKEN